MIILHRKLLEGNKMSENTHFSDEDLLFFAPAPIKVLKCIGKITNNTVRGLR